MVTKLNTNLKGHLLALFTIFVWANTYICTKVLLSHFTPVEILFIRFAIGLAVLFIGYPRLVKTKNITQEIIFALAGLCGVTLYYLFENIALTYTFASNVGIIIAAAPFFTGLLSYIFLKGERPNVYFFIGFVVAMTGIATITFNGAETMAINPFGDFLALMAAVIWAFYSVLSKKITGFGYNIIGSTRRIFEYGVIFMLPALFVLDFSPDWTAFKSPAIFFNFVFLGVLACAVCFATWNKAVQILGAVKTSIYIYINPAITVIVAVIVLNEKITPVSAIGIVLTFTGLLLSEKK